ncbi:MAG: hypothetical protein BHV87_13355 [Clostridiales bacterium 36_14]|nr:MAG: hypothetical protein BHV87_13355 [Clostridiales bacterium 36_14]
MPIIKPITDLRNTNEISEICHKQQQPVFITKYEEELRNFILHELHSGATIYDAIGAYNLDKRHEIITIVDKNEYQKLMNYINKVQNY